MLQHCLCVGKYTDIKKQQQEREEAERNDVGKEIFGYLIPNILGLSCDCRTGK